jgi:hypothetical protein
MPWHALLAPRRSGSEVESLELAVAAGKAWRVPVELVEPTVTYGDGLRAHFAERDRRDRSIVITRFAAS